MNLLANQFGPCRSLGDFLTEPANVTRLGGADRRLWALRDDDTVQALNGLNAGGNFADLTTALTGSGSTITNAVDIDLPVQPRFTCAGIVISTSTGFNEADLTAAPVLAVIYADAPVEVYPGDTLRVPAGAINIAAGSGTATVDAAALIEFAAQMAGTAPTFDTLDRVTGLLDGTATELAGMDYARTDFNWDRPALAPDRYTTCWINEGAGYAEFPVVGELPAAVLSYVATWTQGGDPLAYWPMTDPPTLRNGSVIRSTNQTIALEVTGS